jgi:hypothetical protein
MIGLGSFLITVKVKFSWTALENCALVRDGTLERKGIVASCPWI